MKITIEIPDENIHGALAGPHSGYWAKSCEWDPATCSGIVVAHDCSDVVAMTPEKLQNALLLMSQHCPRHFSNLLASGLYDGVTGDLLLQLIAFGELRYG